MKVPYLLSYIDSAVLARDISFLEISNPVRISFVFPPYDSFPAGNIWLCYGHQVPDLLGFEGLPEEITIFCSGDYGDAPRQKGNRQINLIAVNTELVSLYEQLESLRSREIDWIRLSFRTLMETKNEAVISRFSKILGCSLVLLDADCCAIDCCEANEFKDSCLVDILECGALREAHLPKFFDQCFNQPQRLEAVLHTRDSNLCYEVTITDHGRCLAYLLAFCSMKHADKGLLMKLTSLASSLHEYFFKDNRFLLGSNNQSLCTLLDACLSTTQNSLELINTCIQRLDVEVKRMFTLLIMEFPSDPWRRVPYNIILTQLKSIFPGQNIAVYNQDIVILYTSDEMPYADSLGFDYQRVEQLLENYGAYLGIGQMHSNWVRLQFTYLNVKNTLEFVRVTHRPWGNTRIFYFLDFAMESFINENVKMLQKMGQGNELIYMMFPDVVILKIHDLDHHDDLTQVLHRYLINGRQVNKTARDMGIHRNTLLKKLQQIREVTGNHFEDERYHLFILYSILEMEFYINYMGKDPRKFKTAAPKQLRNCDDILNR